MGRTGWIAMLSVVTLVAGFMAGTAMFQAWLGTDAGEALYPGSTVGRTDVVLGTLASLVWAVAMAISSKVVGRTALVGLLVGFASIAALTLWIGMKQLIVL